MGVGEKMKIFFDNLDFKFDRDSVENNALQARNNMTHQRMNSDNLDEMKLLIRLSGAYKTLIHRVILKIMDYKGFYIDYSKKGITYVPINKNM